MREVIAAGLGQAGRALSDAVYSGFLGSAEQIDIVLDFCRAHPARRALSTVMGDDGNLRR